MAQDTAMSGLQATDADPETPMTALERWQAEPGTFFEGSDIDPQDFMWQARLLVVFGDSPFDPNVQEQVSLLQSDIADLVERDVLVVVDTDPAAESAIRERLRPRGFMLALVGKDGTVALRKPLPWSVRELSRSIDKMPLRQQEIRDRR
ncbi:DUF4174 domain-containing protein [Histidinibacterium lentulum]|uniref:DUF4174 domain-containing protein n=2 Tax=Histidinibacterium lentulum TaxID=2480588 RepID=A0A3N2QMB6_9RHOB|nr:DUF4174 domain-containing protein [Histidinibacterium lentulum]